VPGKVNYFPVSGRTNDSFTIEESHTDIGKHYVSTGVKIGSANHTLNPDSAAQVTFGLLGKDQPIPADAAYFVTPAAETTSEMLVPVFGKVLVDGVVYDGFTSISLNLDGGLQGTKAIGTATAPSIGLGRFKPTITLVPYLRDAQFDEVFVERGRVSIFIFMTESDAVGAPFQAFFCPNVSIGSATRDDGEKPLTQNAEGRLLLKPVTTGWNNTAFQMQDSAYV
jgi:hypothetical protein